MADQPDTAPDRPSPREAPLASSARATRRRSSAALVLTTALAAASPAAADGPTAPPGATSRTPTVALLGPRAERVVSQTGRTIRIWDRASGKQLRSIQSDPLFRGALGRTALVAVTDKGITVWRGKGFRTRVRLRTPKVLAMGRATLSADGTWAAALYPKDGGVGDPDTVGLWNARTGARRGAISLKSGRVLGAVLSDDGRRLALFGDDPARGALLRVYRLGRGKPRPLVSWSSKQDRTVFCAAFSPGGDRLALCAGTRLLLWDLDARKLARATDTAAIKRLFPKPLRGPRVRIPGAHQVAFSPTGKELVTAHAFGVVGVARWDVGSLTPKAWIKRPREGGTLRHIRYDAKGRLWLVTATFSSTVWIHRPEADRFTTARALTP